MAKKNPPTPTEFKYKIKEIIDNKDGTETTHIELDLYICEVMESLGYTEGIRLFRGIPKWYA